MRSFGSPRTSCVWLTNATQLHILAPIMSHEDKGTRLHQKVKAQGGRLTPLRKAMLDEWDASDHLLSANEMMKRLKKKGVAPHKTSIYREIDFLLAQGLVRRITLGGREDRFELAGTPHHHHAVCNDCGEIKHVDFEKHIIKMERQLIRQHFQVNSHLVEFFGLCVDCR